MSLNSDSFVLVIILIFVIILIVVLTTVALVTPPVLLRKLALPDVLVLPGIRPHRSGTIVVIRIDIFFLFRVIRTLRLRLDDHLFQIVLHGYRFHIHLSTGGCWAAADNDILIARHNKNHPATLRVKFSIGNSILFYLVVRYGPQA